MSHVVFVRQPPTELLINSGVTFRSSPATSDSLANS